MNSIRQELAMMEKATEMTIAAVKKVSEQFLGFKRFSAIFQSNENDRQTIGSTSFISHLQFITDNTRFHWPINDTLSNASEILDAKIENNNNNSINQDTPHEFHNEFKCCSLTRTRFSRVSRVTKQTSNFSSTDPIRKFNKLCCSVWRDVWSGQPIDRINGIILSENDNIYEDNATVFLFW